MKEREHSCPLTLPEGKLTRAPQNGLSPLPIDFERVSFLGSKWPHSLLSFLIRCILRILPASRHGAHAVQNTGLVCLPLVCLSAVFCVALPLKLDRHPWKGGVFAFTTCLPGLSKYFTTTEKMYKWIGVYQTASRAAYYRYTPHIL